MIKRAATFVLAAAALFAAGCDDDDDKAPAQIAQGIFGQMGDILPSASAEQREIFERGQAVAEHRFTPEEGLGPDFNVAFCGACHEKPVFGGSAPRYRNFLIIGQELSDGSFVTTGKNGIQTTYDLREQTRVPTDENTNVFATRNPIPFFGVGLLAELPGSAILANADPDDDDGDGISGRPNYDRGFVGRFGVKSQTVSIEGFIRGPLFNHMGLTSDPLSNERKNALPVPSGDEGVDASAMRGLASAPGQLRQGQAAAPDEPTVDEDGIADPELAEQDLFDLVSWSMLLAAPTPAEPTPETEAGEALFAEMRCTSCHTPALEGPRGLIPLYSDLLLHDMGADRGDGVEMDAALPSEFRTQPLWGVVATGPFLHDGVADTLDEAILMHAGEAQASRDAYEALNVTERGQVLAFIESLGGKDQFTEGLLPPNDPIPDVGAVAGPKKSLSAAELEQFTRGRDLFDRDLLLGEGLGPIFNGDSCRACHFEPTIGGAGPLGVNVVRHGNVSPEGELATPSVGTTIAHRFARESMRPPIDESANTYELRQTPPVFGLGLIEAIPAEDILAGQDPDDEDGDGIRGVAHVLPDGRLGRFGWKLDVPLVAEFVRDAMSAELGASLPESDTLTFGVTSDDDDIPDPEMDQATLDDVTFWLENLAGPPRRRTDAALEDAGEGHFEAAGCNSCHRASFETEDGTEVALYSDLLLHDVAPEGYVGVPSGAAGPRVFRTTPLWGLSTTGPFMHNGAATTIEAAIAMHFSEGAASAAAYQALDADARAALLAFLESL